MADEEDIDAEEKSALEEALEENKRLRLENVKLRKGKKEEKDPELAEIEKENKRLKADNTRAKLKKEHKELHPKKDHSYDYWVLGLMGLATVIVGMFYVASNGDFADSLAALQTGASELLQFLVSAAVTAIILFLLAKMVITGRGKKKEVGGHGHH